MNLPTAKTAVTKAVERAAYLGAALALSDLAAHLTSWNTGKFATLTPLLYWALKSGADFLSKNVPNA